MRQHVHQALVHRGCVAPLRRGNCGQAGLEPGHSHAPACLCFLILLVPAQPPRTRPFEPGRGEPLPVRAIWWGLGGGWGATEETVNTTIEK